MDLSQTSCGNRLVLLPWRTCGAKALEFEVMAGSSSAVDGRARAGREERKARARVGNGGTGIESELEGQLERVWKRKS